MFRKLVSNLSFSPGVSTQLAFYARRLRGEDLTRKLSMLFGIGVVVMQLVAIASPAESVNATGPNNVLIKGFVSKNDLITQLGLKDDEHTSARALFDQLKIGAPQITAARDTYIQAKGNTKYSFGRNRMDASDIKKVVDAAGHTFFARTLDSVATTANAHVLEGTTADGKYFAVLFTCGNPVVTTLPPDFSTPTPPPAPVAPKPPVLTLDKTTLSGMPAKNTEVAPGALIGYRINFKNTGGSAATNVFVEDAIPSGTSFVSIGTGGADRTDPNGHLTSVYPGHSQPTDHAYWAYYSMPAGASGYYVDLTVRVNQGVTDGQQICNTASIRSADLPTPVISNPICHNVKLTAVVTNPTTPPAIVPTTPIITTPTPGPQTPPATPVSPNISFSKSAVYIKRGGQTPAGVVDANGTTAGAGDIIEYTLKVLNSGSGDQTSQAISDDIHDILEYADVTNSGAGVLGGGSISWGSATIPAHSTVSKTFQVTVKTPVPPTVRSGSDITSFDLMMDNLFFNKISIKIQPPTAARQVELASQKLPQTGAETNIFIVCLAAALLVYFYGRNRLLIHETAILTVNRRS